MKLVMLPLVVMEWRLVFFLFLALLINQIEHYGL